MMIRPARYYGRGPRSYQIVGLDGAGTIPDIRPEFQNNTYLLILEMRCSTLAAPFAMVRSNAEFPLEFWFLGGGRQPCR